MIDDLIWQGQQRWGFATSTTRARMSRQVRLLTDVRVLQQGEKEAQVGPSGWREPVTWCPKVNLGRETLVGAGRQR